MTDDIPPDEDHDLNHDEHAFLDAVLWMKHGIVDGATPEQVLEALHVLRAFQEADTARRHERH